MLTTMGAGCVTATFWMRVRATMFSLTAVPGSARVASTEAVRLLGFTWAMTSAKPEYVTVTLVEARRAVAQILCHKP